MVNQLITATALCSPGGDWSGVESGLEVLSQSLGVLEEVRVVLHDGEEGFLVGGVLVKEGAVSHGTNHEISNGDLVANEEARLVGLESLLEGSEEAREDVGGQISEGSGLGLFVGSEGSLVEGVKDISN